MCEAFVLVVFSWLPSAIQNYTGAPWAFALFVVVVLAPLLEPQFIAFALARHLAQRASVRPSIGLLAGAGVYVGSEWAFPKLFADTLGHGLYASALLRQAADIAGAHGLTFLLIVANECAFESVGLRRRAPFDTPPREGGYSGRSVLIRMRKFRLRSSRVDPILSGVVSRDRPRSPREALAPVACIAAIVLCLLVYGAVRLAQLRNDDRPGDRITAGIVQADISQYGRLAAELGTFDAVRFILDTHYALSNEVLTRANLDLLVWPETVYPTTFGSPKSEDGAAFDREIGAFVARAGVPLVFGAYDARGGDEFNAAFALEPAADGQLRFDTYRKTWLFPLTERVPALFESSAVRRWLPWLGTWKPGKGPQVLPVRLRGGRTLRIAPLICYDALDPQLAIAAVRQGAEMIVTLSNDSWFSFGQVPRLILVISAFRSIETRRPQVRATNTGISAVIAPTGEFLGTIGVHKRASLDVSVMPQRSATTLMLEWGDWFGPTALACGVALLGLSVRPRRSRA